MEDVQNKNSHLLFPRGRGLETSGEALKWGSKKLIFWRKQGDRSKELKSFYILRAYELKFGPNLGCRNAHSSNFCQISPGGVKICYFCSKWGSKELNHTATGDLKNDKRGIKRGSCLTAGHTRTTFSGECASPTPRAFIHILYWKCFFFFVFCFVFLFNQCNSVTHVITSFYWCDLNYTPLKKNKKTFKSR